MAKQKDRSILLYPRTMELPAQPQTADLRTSYKRNHLALSLHHCYFSSLLLAATCSFQWHCGLTQQMGQCSTPEEPSQQPATIQSTELGTVSRRLDTEFPTERNYNHFALRGCKVRTGWDVLSHSSSNYYALPYSGHWVREGEQKQIRVRTSLVLQWLRIHLPMLGKRVQFLVWEDSTCHRATKPMSHNYWACLLQHKKPSLWEACAPQLESGPHTPQQEKACMSSSEDPAAKKKKKTQTGSPPLQNSQSGTEDRR